MESIEANETPSIARLFTLGKAHEFVFQIENRELIIDRIEAGIHDIVPIDMLYAVLVALKETFGNTEFPLANNVESLNKKKERDGFGKFLYEQNGGKETHAQCSSQLAPILNGAGVFTWNEKRRNMAFTISKMPKDADDLLQILSQYKHDVATLNRTHTLK